MSMFGMHQTGNAHLCKHCNSRFDSESIARPLTHHIPCILLSVSVQLSHPSSSFSCSLCWCVSPISQEFLCAFASDSSAPRASTNRPKSISHSLIQAACPDGNIGLSTTTAACTSKPTKLDTKSMALPGSLHPRATRDGDHLVGRALPKVAVTYSLAGPTSRTVTGHFLPSGS